MIQTALNLLTTRAWAMHPPMVEAMVGLARRGAERGEWTEALRGLDAQAVQTLPGELLEAAPSGRVRVREGVACVPVVGPIFPRANFLTAWSGATSVEMLARDIRAAVEAAHVRAVLLEIDSPGGEVAGIQELAALIGTMRARKPIHAHTDGSCCSGAYWLAAACERISAAQTALLGSIGVVLCIRRPDEELVEIVSSQSPRKRCDPDEPEGRAELQRTADDLAAVFVADVARLRGVSEESVLADFGRGGVLVGAKAVAARMADRVGTAEELLPVLAGKGAPAGSPGQAARRGAGEATMEAEEGQVAGTDPALLARIERLEQGNRELLARNAALETKDARRDLQDRVAGKRFCEGTYQIAGRSREALVTALLALASEERAAVLDAVTGMELMPIDTVAAGAGAEAEGAGDVVLTAADRKIIADEARRKGVSEDEVRERFVGVRRRQLAARAGAGGEA